MKDDDQRIQCDEGLSSVLEKVENDVGGWFKEYPNAVWAFLAVACLLILSPIAVFWLMCDEKGKDWAEVVKNVVESGAVLAAVFAAIKWVNERRDRATEVLLKLDENFQKEAVAAGKKCLEQGDCGGTQTEAETLDGLLRFYVVLYGVLRARQVPESSLSICFRYWLAYYFRRDRAEFRRFVNANYPTLRGWLLNDCRAGCCFFRPQDFWKENEIERDCKKLDPNS
jgi:hypothetical protein